MKNPHGIEVFGKHLRKIREHHGLSQQELADMADVAKLTIQRIENAKFCATIDVLISISKALEIPLNKLTDFELPNEL